MKDRVSRGLLSRETPFDFSSSFLFGIHAQLGEKLFLIKCVMNSLFSRFCLSSDTSVRNHPVFVGTKFPATIISHHEGFVRYPNKPDEWSYVRSRLPLPEHVRKRNWRAHAPLWLKERPHSNRVYDPCLLDSSSVRVPKYDYTFSPWVPYGLGGPWFHNKKDYLPFSVPSSGAKLLRSPDRQPGLLDAIGRTARIREIGLSEALTYGYLLDTRFILLMCLVLGLSIYSFSVPGPLLGEPTLICSPDLGDLVRIGRDTYFDHICSNHRVPSPCVCGEPLNKELPILLDSQELPFDPLSFGVKSRAFGVAVFVGAVILSLSLSESVCHLGFSAV